VNNYDFKSLNDKEFEALACDLIGGHLGEKFERFKAGKDAGVDGRFFLSENREVVLQCKHWANTPISQLINKLSKFERPKISKLKPEKYFIAVTNKLSRQDKKKIRIALSPYINSESYIYGSEDLNDLLAISKNIEQRHYKLWLHSSSVLTHMMNHAILGRSEYTLDEIKMDTARYAMTENHKKALAQLENLGVIIITGEPGIGKTTLANHLCLHYVAQSHHLAVISDDIKEAEDILDDDSKQIFYFDDFLGRNYLDALNGHEGKKITQFIKRIARSPNKKFVLTSRSTILNQGKLLIDVFSHANLQRNEYEMKISSLSDIDKAHILYNQIWHSQLKISHENELYRDERYRRIISHKNFNPRLINYVTDASRVGNIEPNLYWNFVEKSLINPADIWENPFIAQQDDFGRAIVLLVVLNRYPIMQDGLADAYHEYISLPGNQNMKGRQDFTTNLKTLIGSFLNRLVEGDKVRIDLFNPSIGDYVLQRYRTDISALKLGFICLKNCNSLQTLKSLRKNSLISLDNVEIIAVAMLERVAINDFLRADVSFVSELVRYVAEFSTHDKNTLTLLKDGTRYVLETTKPTDSTRNAFSVVKLGFEKKWVTNQEALKFVDNLAHFVVADEEVEDCWALMCILSIEDITYGVVKSRVIDGISDHIAQNFSRFLDIDIAFLNCSPGEYDVAKDEILKILEEKLDSLGLNADDFDFDYIIQKSEVKEYMDKYFENLGTSVISPPSPLSSHKLSSRDQIDELFERGR
jgi:adenylate kinase family enzyme